jgi:antitoxin HicB
MNLHYSIVIEWSDEDQAYVVVLPEWEGMYAMPVTDGKTYEEALERAKNVLENFIDFAQQDGVSLPAPKVYATVTV